MKSDHKIWWRKTDAKMHFITLILATISILSTCTAQKQAWTLTSNSGNGVQSSKTRQGSVIFANAEVAVDDDDDETEDGECASFGWNPELINCNLQLSTNFQ